MVRNFLYILIFAAWVLFLTSCEKVLDLELESVDQVLVIEGTVEENGQGAIVRISKTTDYYSDGTTNPVSGASVRIINGKGFSAQLDENSPGVYTSPNIKGRSGQTYSLVVEYDGKTYQASSYMGSRPEILDLQMAYLDGMGIIDSGYSIATYLHDPDGEENFYRIRYLKNGKVVTGAYSIVTFSDKLFNGKDIGLDSGYLVFQKNDTVMVELMAIDEAVYKYFSTLDNILEGIAPQSAAPANPVSNISGGALGYFSAYAVDRKQIIIR
jgi:hypothetical protein